MACSLSSYPIKKVVPSSSLYPPRISTPQFSVCSNRTRGSPGCAHLIRGAGVAARGSAPSSAQRAARSALRRREHPALTIPNGFFQQRGARADRLARRKAGSLPPSGHPGRNAWCAPSSCWLLLNFLVCAVRNKEPLHLESEHWILCCKQFLEENLFPEWCSFLSTFILTLFKAPLNSHPQ